VDAAIQQLQQLKIALEAKQKVRDDCQLPLIVGHPVPRPATLGRGSALRLPSRAACCCRGRGSWRAPLLRSSCETLRAFCSPLAAASSSAPSSRAADAPG
jgi:hypothetical protein